MKFASAIGHTERLPTEREAHIDRQGFAFGLVWAAGGMFNCVHSCLNVSQTEFMLELDAFREQTSFQLPLGTLALTVFMFC